MKKEVLKCFNSFMATAQLALITFKDCESNMQLYELSTWTRIKDENLASNYNSNVFESSFDAEDNFKDFVIKWI